MSQKHPCLIHTLTVENNQYLQQQVPLILLLHSSLYFSMLLGWFVGSYAHQIHLSKKTIHGYSWILASGAIFVVLCSLISYFFHMKKELLKYFEMSTYNLSKKALLPSKTNIDILCKMTLIHTCAMLHNVL